MQAFLNEKLGSLSVDIFIVLGIIKGKTRIYDKYATKNSILDNSWAVVTGGSDGIGLAMCKKLAKEGFNICIISRTESKINEKLDEIRNECRRDDAAFKTMALTADLWKLKTIEEYKTTIADKLADLDVAVLCLNAGYAQGGPFLDLTNEEVERHCQVNVNHVLYTAKVMIGQLVKRAEEKKTKSAMIITSSLLADVPMPGVCTYAASKMFEKFMAIALFYEFRDTVDVMGYQPGGVATKMIRKTKASMDTIMPNMAADVCFRDLGYAPVTSGAFRHVFAGWFFNFIPLSLLAKSLPMAKKELEKERARKLEEA